MDKEQILALLDRAGHRLGALFYRHPAYEYELTALVDAAIESYKAELLKEVGEPELRARIRRILDHHSVPVNGVLEADLLYGVISDQVAAAILKATGPIKDEVERLSKLAYIGEHQFDDCTWKHRHGELRAKLSAAQEEIESQKKENWFQHQQIMGLQSKLAKAEQRVAEAIHDMTDEVCAPLQKDDKSIDYWHGVGDAAVAIEKAIVACEWRKFVKEV